MDFARLLHEIDQEIRPDLGRGRLADYIPELTQVDPDRFGIALTTCGGEEFCAGDARIPFSIQSVSKLFTLTLILGVLKENSEVLWKRVHARPTNDSFNSLIQLELERGIPRNPFINSGALVVTDLVMSHIPDPLQTLLDFVRELSGNPDIQYNTRVARSELQTGFRNAAMLNLLKSFGNIENDLDRVLDLYCHQCSLEMSCVDLARAFSYLANGGVHPATGRAVVSQRQSKRLNAVMLTCGTYNGVGEFAFRVGLPAKSGVGGGIVAVLPNQWSIAVWSPRLNDFGNSLAGTAALELLTTRTGQSLF